jgi:16S rRNA processing protein RimM
MNVPWDEMVLVGVIARAHGLRGDVVVRLETDFPDQRYRAGETLYASPAAGAGPRALTVRAARWHGPRLLVAFEGIDRVEDAEALGRCELRIEPDRLPPLPPGQYYHHDLVGCEVVTVGGDRVGPVSRVEAQGPPTLAVRGPRGEILIPLAAEICVEIDLAQRRIVVAPPDGLLDVNGTAGRALPRGRGAGGED